MLIFIVIVILLFIAGSFFFRQKNSYQDVSIEDAKMLVENNPYLVVIDASPYYAQGHILGAVNYYVGDGSLDEVIPKLDKNKEYLVYCHTNEASIEAAKKLAEAGLIVYRLDGGYQAWLEAEYPVEEP